MFRVLLMYCLGLWHCYFYCSIFSPQNIDVIIVIVTPGKLFGVHDIKST